MKQIYPVLLHYVNSKKLYYKNIYSKTGKVLA